MGPPTTLYPDNIVHQWCLLFGSQDAEEQPLFGVILNLGSQSFLAACNMNGGPLPALYPVLFIHPWFQHWVCLYLRGCATLCGTEQKDKINRKYLFLYIFIYYVCLFCFAQVSGRRTPTTEFLSSRGAAARRTLCPPGTAARPEAPAKSG